MDGLFSTEAILALLTLTALEIVLSIDNIIFLSVLVDKLPQHQRARARILGLGFALLSRIALLLSITWVMKLTTPFLTVFDNDISGKDLILLAGGLFLIAKSTHEIHCGTEEPSNELPKSTKKAASHFAMILVQIALIDIIFSLDSVVTAVGMTNHLWVMIIAIIISTMVMMIAAGPIGDFVSQHPTFKMLALSFLILIGVTLIAEGLDFHIPKGYIYFAMAFSLIVEALNIKVRQKKS
ncbi:MAG: TerC family protein [Candidatus Endonucleobacter bathymodioli]|uniref:TerC family protein n=1 Tax=Candidatus Endonucleibacter bathymodioli TaxID=539814 RepID=A0AA90NQ81_9GAMM|nr:TerC family protein [Candidatus Endonucleobacter bathymodioli]